LTQEDRSKMNVTFKLHNETLTEEFDKVWKAAGIVGLPGHRSVGGYTAHLYIMLYHFLVYKYWLM
jgi:phosphoserine aminotransferase